MERCPSFFSFVGLALLLAAGIIGSHATSSSEAYWQKVLPNTTMPSAIRDFFNLDLINEKMGTTVDVGKGRVHMGTGKPKGGTTVGVGKGVFDAVIPRLRYNRYNVRYAANIDAAYQLHDLKVTLFFLKKDLHIGSKMNLILFDAISGSTLPHGSLSGPPLDGKKLAQVLNQFSIKPKSPEAEAIKETLEACIGPAGKDEDKYCATSVEPMINFTVSKLGMNVQALVTNVDKNTSNQQYIIAPGVQKMGGPTSVTCHAQTYVYPVYYCHKIPATSAYIVPLVGMDGSKVKAVGVCHEDTSSWDPTHISFQLLKVKPGSDPICHILAQDNVVWVQN